MSVDQQFTAVNEKLQRLLKQYSKARREVDQLTEALAAQKQETEAAKGTIAELKQQVAILKLASGDMPDRDKKDFERQINKYVKQIDKCIAYLSQ